MIYLQLFFEFMKIGLFAVGGGMATLPFLQRLGEKTGWFSQMLITDMVAISESTPGPIGVNMATYVGYNVGGLLGGFVATMGLAFPCIILSIVFSKFLAKLSGNKYLDYAFYGMRPAVTGLIAAAAVSVWQVAVFNSALFAQTGVISDLIDIKKIILFAVMFFAIKKFKKHPISYIAISAVIGLIFKF
ncbi:MAG: chromate transporter [Oscillospiraceae bacterium]|nr:chromate transporter [Oscillospiraceae bacterium]MBQ7815801.1 chromate transporter [Oscillospiraceae bacterium]